MSKSISNRQSSARKGSTRTTVAVVVAAGLVSGMALAAVTATGKMQGTVGRGQFDAYWSTGSTATVVDPADSPVGTLSFSADKKTVIWPTGTEVYVGEYQQTKSLDIGRLPTGTVPTKTSTKASYVGGITGTPSAGWKVSMIEGCGMDVPKPTSGQAYSGTRVTLRVEPVDATSPVDPLDLSNVKVSLLEGTAPGGLVCAPLVAP